MPDPLDEIRLISFCAYYPFFPVEVNYYGSKFYVCGWHTKEWTAILIKASAQLPLPKWRSCFNTFKLIFFVKPNMLFFCRFVPCSSFLLTFDYRLLRPLSIPSVVADRRYARTIASKQRFAFMTQLLIMASGKAAKPSKSWNVTQSICWATLWKGWSKWTR